MILFKYKTVAGITHNLTINHVFKDNVTVTTKLKIQINKERLGYLRNPRSLKEGTET